MWNAKCNTFPTLDDGQEGSDIWHPKMSHPVVTATHLSLLIGFFCILHFNLIYMHLLFSWFPISHQHPVSSFTFPFPRTAGGGVYLAHGVVLARDSEALAGDYRLPCSPPKGQQGTFTPSWKEWRDFYRIYDHPPTEPGRGGGEQRNSVPKCAVPPV